MDFFWVLGCDSLFLGQNAVCVKVMAAFHFTGTDLNKWYLYKILKISSDWLYGLDFFPDTFQRRKRDLLCQTRIAYCY